MSEKQKTPILKPVKTAGCYISVAQNIIKLNEKCAKGREVVTRFG